MNESDCILAFSNATGIGPKSFLKLLKIYGSVKDAWKESSPEKFKEAGVGEANYIKFQQFKPAFNIEEYKLKLKKTKVEFIPYGDKYYPENLKQIDSPPIGLYVKGNKNLLVMYQSPSHLWGEGKGGGPVIAVVGTRKTTSYGRQVTEQLVSQLVDAGFLIVSGMALGVDGIAHTSAIENKGSTIAVLGCGVDCPYPRENEKVYEDILDSDGLIISEYPLGMPANPGTFPARNRIVAGLSSAVLITEAAEDSGSLITAEIAIKQGKKVFAVPGPITSQTSRGAIKLIKQGAIMVSSIEDILNELQVKINKSKFKIESQKLKLSGIELKIYDVILNEEKSIDDISKETGMSVSKLMSILSGMELSGIIENSDGKFSVL